MEQSAHSVRLLTPCLNTTMAEVVSSRQNLREGLEEHARFMAACLVEGVRYLHEHNVLHRDITPDNVYLDSTGYPKLVSRCSVHCECFINPMGHEVEDFIEYHDFPL